MPLRAPLRACWPCPARACRRRRPRVPTNRCSRWSRRPPTRRSSTRRARRPERAATTSSGSRPRSAGSDKLAVFLPTGGPTNLPSEFKALGTEMGRLGYHTVFLAYRNEVPIAASPTAPSPGCGNLPDKESAPVDCAINARTEILTGENKSADRQRQPRQQHREPAQPAARASRPDPARRRGLGAVRRRQRGARVVEDGHRRVVARRRRRSRSSRPSTRWTEP